MSADGDTVRAALETDDSSFGHPDPITEEALAALDRLEAAEKRAEHLAEQLDAQTTNAGLFLTQRDALAEVLRNIAANAFGWHGPEAEQDTGPVRALTVIGKWAEDALAEAELE